METAIVMTWGQVLAFIGSLFTAAIAATWFLSDRIGKQNEQVARLQEKQSATEAKVDKLASEFTRWTDENGWIAFMKPRVAMNGEDKR